MLGATRVVLTILDDTGAETEMVTFDTALGRVVRGPVSGPDLTWEMAARILGRPYRYHLTQTSVTRVSCKQSCFNSPKRPWRSSVIFIQLKGTSLCLANGK